jgi:hypothetical protein
MTFHLIDAMSVLRAKLEKDPGGLLFRNMFHQYCEDRSAVRMWVWDGKNNIATRKAIYPLYKANRPPAGEDIWAGLNLFRDLLHHTGDMQVTVPGFEADDVIAHLSRSLAQHGTVKIETRDFDLYQLEIPDRVSCFGARAKEVPTHLIRLYKTWVGDGSDNIKGVKGFGQGAWDDTPSYDRLQKLTDGIIARCVPNDEILADAGVPKKCWDWIKANGDMIRAMWKVVGFMDLTDHQLNAGFRPGKLDKVAGEALLREYLL